MKKLTKLLVLVMSLALICGIFAVAAFAEDTTGEVENGATETAKFEYTDSEGVLVSLDATAENFVSALKNVPSGGTVSLTGDATIIFSEPEGFTGTGNNKDYDIANRSAPYTIDLGGNTLVVATAYPGQYRIKVNRKITVTNGTLATAGFKSTTSEAYAEYPLFFLNNAQAELVFDNVNTYSGCLIYSYSAQGASVTVKGGEHYVLTGGRGADGAWFSTRSNVNFSAENALFYTNGSSYVVSFNAGYSAASKVTEGDKTYTVVTPCTATFKGCTLIDSGSNTLFKYGTEFVNFTFDDCDIFGKIAFSASTAVNKNADKDNADFHVNMADHPITSENVTFKNGTRVMGAKATFGYTVAEGNIGYGISSVTETKNINVGSTTPYVDIVTNGKSFEETIVPTDVSVKFDVVVGSLEDAWFTENNDYAFTVTSAGTTYYTDHLSVALTYAPAGATITLNKDYETVNHGSVGIISNALTIDLNGHRLSISQSSYESYITIATNETVTIKNGVLVASGNNQLLNAGEAWAVDRKLDGGIPVFVAYEGANGVTGLAVDLVVDNVDTYVPTIFHNESATGSKFTLNGGNHQALSTTVKLSINGTKTTALGNGGVIQSRTNTVAEFNNANIYMTYCSSLFANSHKNVPSGTDSYTKLTYTDCTLIQAGVDNKPIILYSDSNTYAYFNGCDIYGAFITPSKEAGEAFGTKNVIFGEGTRHGWATSYNVTKDGVTTTYNVTTFEPTIAEGIQKFTFNSTMKFSDTITVGTTGQFHTNDGGVAAFLTAKDFSKSWTCNYAYGTPAFELVKDGETIQRPYNSGYTLYTAISNADEGTTVKLLADYTIETATSLGSIDKALTLDLNGHTITVIQEHQNANFGISATATVTIKNGTFIAGANNSYANIKGAPNYAAPLFRTNATCDLVFDNVTFYGSTVVYNYGQRAATVKVTFNKFNYYGIFNQADATSPSIVDSRGNIAVTVTDSNLYLEKGYLLSSISNKVTGADTVKKSTFIFDNCKIYSTDSSRSVISNASNRTFVEFTNCDIIGTFSPSLKDWDSSTDTKTNLNGVPSSAMPATNIVFNEGCRWGYSGTSALTPTYKNGIIYLGDSTSTNDFFPSTGSFLNYQDGAFTIEDGKFVLPTVASSKTATYNYSSSVVEGVDYVFEYVKGGATYWTPETGTDTIVDVLNSATVGSTIKLLRDYTWKGTKVKYVQRDYTLDLGGFTFTHQQSLNANKNYTSSYLDLQNGTFTIKNGTIRAMLVDAEGNDTGKNYPVIRMSYSSAAYKSITLNVENVNTYVGPFIYNMNVPGVTINITGGEHHLTNSYQNVSGSFIESRANTNATVTGAKFYVSNSTNGLVISMSYYQTTGDKASSFVFDGCEIVCNSSNKNIVPNSNEFTTIAFNNCKIVGSITPTKHSFDEDFNGPKTGSIVLDSATTLETAKIVADIVSLSDELMKQLTFKYTAKGVTYYATVEDLAAVITNADEDTDVTDDVATLVLLDDIRVHLTANLSIGKNITIDLNGHTLFIEQNGIKNDKGAFTASYSLVTSKSLKFMNGTVMLAASEQYGFGKATAIVQPGSGAKIYFKDTNTYGYALTYSYDKAYSVFVDGGEHHVNAAPGNVTYPGWICGNSNITADVRNATIYLEYKSAYLVGFQNYKVATNVTPESTASFYNCTIVDNDSENGIIQGLNKYSTVTFEKCDIFGKIAPGATSNDGDNKNPVAGSIVIGAGCRFTNDTIGNSAVKVGAGVRITEKEFTETLTFKAANSLWNVEGFKLEDSTKTVTYTMCDAALAGDQGDVENSFSVIVNGEVIGAYADLASAIEAAPAGATIKLLNDVTIDAYGLIATIDKALTIDLDGKHLQIVQHMANSQIIINTTAPVTITNGRISCAADAVYRKTLTSTGQAYDVGEPIFVSTSVAVDFTLNGISTYSAGLFYNTVSGSKFTVIGGYHKQNSITYPNLTYLDRALIVSKANITVLFQNASIDMDWCGSLLISTAHNESSYDNAHSTFTYENCQVYYTGNDNQIIRVANDKTFVYFKGSDVYGAFVRPTKKDGSNFTSANLHFDANTTWYNVNPAGKTLVTPTLPEGYIFASAIGSAANISFTKYAIAGQIHNGTLIFPATSTTGSFTVNSVVAVKGNAQASITAGNHVIYCLENATLADIVKIAMAYDGSVITFLSDITFQPTGYMDITKNVTFDLNGHVLTLIHDGQDKTFRLNAAVTATFENGTIITTPGASYAENNSTFCFVYVNANNANLVFDGVDGRVTTLVYAWGASYTITVNDGTFVLDTAAAGMNTSGFISGQANITATVNNTTLFVENGYILGASSYRQFHNQNNKETTIEDVKKGIKSTFTFNNCNIIGNNVNKNLISNANEFTTVTFNGGTIYGNISPIKNASDGTLNYIQIGNKFYTNPTVCTCATFSDTNGDGKCDNVVGESACGKFDPAASIKSFTFAESTAANFIIGKGTYFSASTNVKLKTTLADKLIAQNIAKNINIGGINYSFDYVADYVYVIWYDANGNELERVPVDDDFTGIAAPEYTVPATGANNGWYQIGGFVQGGWTTTFGGNTAVDFSTITDFSANLNFYPQASGGITAYLSAAMYNLSIVGQIRNNFYIPVDMPENVEILRVYLVDENGNMIKEVAGTEILFRDYKNDPVYYTMYVINYVDAVSFTESTRVWVDYTVDGTPLTQKYTISPEKYANTVYADSQKTEGNQYNDAAYEVVADLVRYSYLLSEYAKAANSSFVIDASLADLYNKMKGLCSELPTDMTPDKSVNESALAGVGSIAFEASEFNPRWKFTLNESAQIVDIKITLLGYNSGVLDDRTNYGEQIYGITTVTKTNGYITEAYTQNIPVYNLTQPFTITMVKADGTEISAITDLNTYYADVKDVAAVADFLKAVVALANSTVSYKFPDGKITVNDVADFWECDHPADMVNKLDEVVAYTNVFKPHYCQKCDSYLFYYEDYGAVADGVTAHNRATHISGTNNYEAIYWTHANANEWKARTDLSGGKHVAVIGNSDPTVAKNYYISLPEGIGLYKIDTNLDGVVDTVYKNGQNLDSIIVATDTSWNGVNLLIDDDSICNHVYSAYDADDPNKPATKEEFAGCDCGRKHAYTGQPIFILDEYGSEKVEQNWKGKLTSLSAGATNIGFAPGRDMLVHLVDADKNIYLRYGANASNGNAISEVILVHADGTIDPSTPVQWDYTNLNNQDSDKVMAYAVDTEEIKISGLDANGQINAIFETYVNNDVKQYLYHYEQSARNITIRRSNATVEGLDRIFLEEAADNANNTNDRMAYTFIKVEYCSDVTIKDMLVMNHNSHGGDTGTSQGSYEFSAGYANDVKWINCDTKNMFSAGKDGSLIAYPVYRGLFGTNHMRNMYLADCTLNSFDAHTGAYNVTIENSTFDHMNFIGGGLIKLTNVTVYPDKDYAAAIYLRTDYGSTWKGDLEIDGLTIMYGEGDMPNNNVISLIYGIYVNQYWGFDTYMPQNVTINNFHVEKYKAEIINGERIETTLGRDGSDVVVYYYYGATAAAYNKKAGHINNLTASEVPATSAAGKHGPQDKGDSSITYDYGTNHLVCTKNLTITNSVTMNLPTGDFWKDMNVSMNGSEYVWTEKKIGSIVLSAGFEKQ